LSERKGGLLAFFDDTLRRYGHDWQAADIVLSQLGLNNLGITDEADLYAALSGRLNCPGHNFRRRVIAAHRIDGYSDQAT
jgi:hypothetical protein